jgi:hypothetical protein
VNRDKRIRQLELRVFGNDDENGMTWEEFLHCYWATDPEHFRKQAKSDFNMQRIMESPPPRNLDRLIRRWQPYFAAQDAQRRADQRRAAQTGVEPDSQSPSTTSPTCSSPVLTGCASDESTTGAKTDKEHSAPSASQSQPAGDPNPAAPTMTQVENPAQPPRQTLTNQPALSGPTGRVSRHQD